MKYVCKQCSCRFVRQLRCPRSSVVDFNLYFERVPFVKSLEKRVAVAVAVSGGVARCPLPVAYSIALACSLKLASLRASELHPSACDSSMRLKNTTYKLKILGSRSISIRYPKYKIIK